MTSNQINLVRETFAQIAPKAEHFSSERKPVASGGFLLLTTNFYFHFGGN